METLINLAGITSNLISEYLKSLDKGLDKKRLPATLDKAIDAMQSASVAIDTSGGDFSYLKLAKSGDWVHGADDDEINLESQFAVSTESFFAGFQAWDEGELAGEEVRLLTEPPLTHADLADVGAEWKPLIGFQLVGVDGADNGLQLIYKTTAKGGIKAVNTLMKTIVAHVREGNHDGKLIPIIELGTDSYRHKRYGKIFTPILKVVDWVADLPQGATVADAPETDEVDDPTPRRRRRRTA